jgi:hypothetical protein
MVVSGVHYKVKLMYDNLTDENFLIYCAKHYDNPQCHSTEEFLEDLKHLKYIKKLLTRYIENGDLKERLILNHITILYNLFGAEHLPRILYLKMQTQFCFLKPFLIMLNILPDKLYNIKNEKIIDVDFIPMDNLIVEKLRMIINDR